MKASTCSHLAALLLLAACARTAPPAPVVAGDARSAAPASRPAGVPRPVVAHPDSVVVQPGETVYGIARRYDVPVRSLIEANGLTAPYQLASGRSVILPQVRQHIVQGGETLYAISRLYGVDTSTLAQSNGLQPPYLVRVGQSLVLPAPVETASARPQAPVIQATAPAASYGVPAATAPATVPPPTVARNELPAPPAPPVVAPPPAAAEPKLAVLPPPAAAPAPSPREGGRSFLWPLQGRILGAYGAGEGGTHNDGINIAAPEGSAVVAADAGTVAYAGNELRGYGNLVLIKHADGWMTAYAHNAALLVKRGEKVRRGQTIARVGSTGAVGEPQLHFEIRHGTRALDPGDYLPPQAATASRG